MSTKVRYITKGKEYRRSEYQMKQILIATHGKMASGIRYTAELIVGKMDEITTIDAYETWAVERNPQRENMMQKALHREKKSQRRPPRRM